MQLGSSDVPSDATNNSSSSAVSGAEDVPTVAADGPVGAVGEGCLVSVPSTPSTTVLVEVFNFFTILLHVNVFMYTMGPFNTVMC